MADVFLSYSHKDETLIPRVTGAFRTAGYTLWWDQRLTPVAAWDRTITEEISAACAVLVLWTPSSADSEYVAAEAHFAKENRKLVPALCETCDVPLFFRQHQWADLRGWMGDSANPQWVRALGWIEHLVGRPPNTLKAQPPPTPVAQPKSAIASLKLSPHRELTPPPSSMAAGAKLVWMRELLGITLDQASERTLIRRNYLEALEDMNIGVLPGKGFTRSYLKSYAKFLLLDADELVKQFDAETSTEPRTGFDPTDPLSWRNRVRDQHPCPSNSGKMFIHCHGQKRI